MKENSKVEIERTTWNRKCTDTCKSKVKGQFKIKTGWTCLNRKLQEMFKIETQNVFEK